MNEMPKTAMVLAAGLGKRMRPLTDDRPKPLVEVAGKALIDYALDRFAAAGIARAVVNVHYFADMLEAHLKQRARPQILISDERGALLETGGGLKKAAPLLGSAAFYCANTDAILLDEDGEEACRLLARGFDPETMDALLLLVPRERTSGYQGAGDFDIAADKRIAFRAGPTAAHVFTGLQILSPQLLEDAPEEAFSTRLLWERAQRKGRLYGAVYSGSWMHVGDMAGLKAAEARLALPEGAR